MVDAEREELRLLVSDAEPEDEPASGELVDRRRRLRQKEGIPVRASARWVRSREPRRGRGGETEGDERVETLVPAGLQPSCPGHGVLGEREQVEAGPLGGGGHLVERPGVEEIAAGPLVSG